jgi:hypothetical protein
MATFGFVLSYPRALTEMWGLEPKLPVTRQIRHLRPRAPSLSHVYCRVERGMLDDWSSNHLWRVGRWICISGLRHSCQK